MSEGWGKPGNSRKYHYFVNGRSLCGRWLYIGSIFPDDGIVSDLDCIKCHRRLARRKENETN